MSDAPGPERSEREFGRWWIPFAVLAVVGIVFWVATQISWTPAPEPTSWTELKQLVADGEINTITFEGEMVRAEKKAVEPEKPEVIRVVRVEDEAFLPLLEEQGVPYRRQVNPCAQGAVLWLMAPVLMLGLFWVIMSRQSGPTRGMATFGRSSAAMAPEEGTGVTFADVAGVEEAAEELQEVIAFLRTPEKFTSLGGRPPKGVLLVGPPGTGKTLLARAVAGEAGVPFFSISGSAFVEMFVGVGAARVRDLFKTAVDHAPCIIFIDELDAVGKARGASAPSGNEEREQTLNQLLVEMDGFDNRRGIIVMAATNRPEILDNALLRPGRFDRQVVVDRPDVRGREAILRVHGERLKLAEDVDFGELAKITPGFAGADLANVLNEAALLAARRDQTAIRRSDIEDAIERVIGGLEKKNRRLSEREKRTVAYHECGHAICAAASPEADPVKKISIIPRGVAALGYTITMPAEDRYLSSKADLLNRITVLYGGRAAEEVVFGDVTNGASDDIRKATQLARLMVTAYGMSHNIGAVDYASRDRPSMLDTGPGGFVLDASPDTAEAIEREVHQFLSLCHDRARQILRENRPLLDEMSSALLETEVLAGPAMDAFLSRVQPAPGLAEQPVDAVAPAH